MHVSVKGIILLLATILWLIFALYLSHQDGEHTALTSLRLAEKFLGWDESIEPDEGVRALNGQLRRIAHVVVYTVLAVLTFATVASWISVESTWMSYLAAFAALIIIAIIDEVTKIPVEGRHCSAVDIGLNILGVAIGTMIIVLVGWISAR